MIVFDLFIRSVNWLAASYTKDSVKLSVLLMI